MKDCSHQLQTYIYETLTDVCISPYLYVRWLEGFGDLIVMTRMERYASVTKKWLNQTKKYKIRHTGF